jgi:hypothetical protein
MEMGLILFVLAMGLALGWMLAHSTVKDYYLAEVEKLEMALKWEKGKVQALASDLERVNQKQSVKAKETVQRLVQDSENSQALEKGWAWVLGREPKQE